LDHQFSFEMPEVSNEMNKVYHHPQYEDKTKIYQTNQLLNYNLVSYPHKDKVDNIRRIGDLATSFDDENYMVDGEASLASLLEQYENRVNAFSGSQDELISKQRNIFDLQKPLLGTTREVVMSPTAFPYFYRKHLPSLNQGQFNNILSSYGKTKNLLQAIKSDKLFPRDSFSINGVTENVKLYDVVRLMTSTRIVKLEEVADELYLLPESEIEHGQNSNRFVDQVNTVRFLSEMRRFILNNSRKYEDVINSIPCKTFVLGYKIEKYIDNDLGQPIQTYYTNGERFVDTQMKYGRRYIYKTKVLVGVLGSSYIYSNLFYSKNEIEMIGSDGALASSYPANYSSIVSEKFRGYVDVEVSPSFQIVELDIDDDEVAFVDSPVLPPHVEFSTPGNKPNIGLHFSPTFARVESVTSRSNSEIMRSLRPLQISDEKIVNLLRISKDDSARPDYFTGIYEVFRMTRPPQIEKDFADHFLASIDDKTSLWYPKQGLTRADLDNMNGYIPDKVRPNKKYYYAFRAITYHGTPSNLTLPYEIELVEDAEGFKVSVKEYRYPTNNNYTYKRGYKRLVRIVPNLERLLFSEEEDRSTWRLDDDNMLALGETAKFKIRVTSKHTGKKIDINLNIKLRKDENSFGEN